MFFDWIKGFYDAGKPGYTNDGVKVFVRAGWITAEQYKGITDFEYVA